MGYADGWYEDENGPGHWTEIAAVKIDEGDGSCEAVNDEFDAPWGAFDDEIEAWARHALAANGFGDY